jgi:hypothetical protein
MNSLERALQVDVSGYERVAPHEPPLAASEPTRALLPLRDVVERSPVPVINGTFPSSDALRSYHLGGMVPQSRAPMPAPASAQGAGTQITNVVSTSTSSTTTNTLPQIQLTSVSTPVLSPNTQFQTAASMIGEGWNFLSVSVSPQAACRIRLYGTPAAQTGDASRNQFTPAGLGTEQDLILDVLFDGVSGAVWDCQGVSGNNNQPGVSQLCFVTVDNLSGGSAAFSVTLQYSPLCQ